MFKKNISTGILLLIDFFIIHFASFLALWIRFDFKYNNIDLNYFNNLFKYFFIYTISAFIIFFFCKFYSSMLTVAGVYEFYLIFLASILLSLSQFLGFKIFHLEIINSFYILNFIFLFLLLCLFRLSFIFIKIFNHSILNYNKKQSRILIVGAGATGSNIIKELNRDDYLSGKVICAIDDNKSKINKYINGVLIVGNRNKILESVKKYKINEIYITMPTATSKDKKEILEICKQTNCKLKILPSYYELLNNKFNMSKLREVELKDLLGREIKNIHTENIEKDIFNKIILITGGGGSIGSELCRQISVFNPKKLIILDISEENCFNLQEKLKKDFYNLDFEILIGSVKDLKIIEKIFEKYNPEIIYHTAAYKHVPLMENNPLEAITNNIFGTLNLVKTAKKFNLKKFILISSDKAVNPTNIMGATKRICELIIQSYNKISTVEFVAVRFGNVLGSSGSVIPLFKNQIKNGGPLTVTDINVIRYFMTIEEAVNLVLQAGSFGKGGEIFVLDMGEPIKINDLAKNLIRFSGLILDEDIKIEYTGLRPGEKLFEEILINKDKMKTTKNNLIFIEEPLEIEKDFLEKINNLEKELEYNLTNLEIKKQIQKIVPSYKILKN